MRAMTFRRVIAVCTLAALAAGCTHGSSPGPQSSSAAATINASTAPLLPTAVGDLPEMDVTRFGQLMEQLRGTPVVVNLWGSWCGPCRDEAPHLASAARRYGTHVQFLGVDVKDPASSARDYIQEFHLPFPSIADPNGAIEASLQFIGPPDTIFFDAQGLAKTTISGPIDPARLQSEIQAILPAQPSG
jgi:thiol-disulfide isomerase/thioredoxin